MRGQAGIPYATIPGNQPGGDGDVFDDDSGGDDDGGGDDDIGGDKSGVQRKNI